MGAMATRYDFPRHVRLRHKRDFDAVFATGVYAADPTLVVNAARNELGYTRLGVVVSRKTGNAVVRNRWKRLIREAFRHERWQLPAGLDLVARPRWGGHPELTAIRRALAQLSRRVERNLNKTATRGAAPARQPPAPSQEGEP